MHNVCRYYFKTENNESMWKKAAAMITITAKTHKQQTNNVLFIKKHFHCIILLLLLLLPPSSTDDNCYYFFFFIRRWWYHEAYIVCTCKYFSLVPISMLFPFFSALFFSSHSRLNSSFKGVYLSLMEFELNVSKNVKILLPSIIFYQNL